MTNNDSKIKDLLEVIASKKKELGEKPRASWKTNGILKKGNDGYTNINTITDVNVCVSSVAFLLSEKYFQEESSKLLGIPCPEFVWNGASFEDWVHDFKLRVSMLTWDIGKKKLNSLESKLSDLRSEDAKTADAISNIMKELN